MGIGEAGYYAGVIYYLSFWYKRYVIVIYFQAVVQVLIPTQE